MSAATPRPPARAYDVLRAELVVLKEARAHRWGWLMAYIAFTGDASATAPREPLDLARMIAWLAFFLPLAWQGDGGSRRANVALPIGGVTLDLVRVACGAACAALLMALGIVGSAAALWLAGYGPPGTLAGFPLWYPAALLIVGLAHYLFGAAAMLLAERPRRVLVAVSCLAIFALLLTGIRLETREYDTWRGPDGYHRIGSTSLTLAAAWLRLAIAAGTVWACAAAGRRARREPPWNVVGWFRARRLLPAVHARTTPEALAGPRTQPSLARVAGRQFVLLAPRMLLPLLVAAVVALGSWNTEAAVNGPAPAFIDAPGTFAGLWVLASLWPLLVWMDERGSHDWDGAQPVDSFVRELVHAAAGVAWLWILTLVLLAARVWGAMAAGTLATPAALPAWVWPGIPVSVLVLYCLGLAPAHMSERPVQSTLLSILFLGPAAFILIHVATTEAFSLDAAPRALGPTRLLAPLNWTHPEDWSGAAALLWTPVCVAVGAWALWVHTCRDRFGAGGWRRELGRHLRHLRFRSAGR